MTSRDPALDAMLSSLCEAFRSGRHAEFEALMLKFMAALAENADIKSDPGLKWSLVAAECEDRGDWGSAEAAYREKLIVRGETGHDRLSAYKDLVALCRLLGRMDEARQYARLATEAAREEDLSVLLAMAMCMEARLCIEASDYETGGILVAELLDTFGEDDEMVNGLRAEALILRAQCSLVRGEADAAAADLETAYARLAPWRDMDIAAGTHRSLSQLHAIRGALRAMQGDVAGATESWQEAVARARHVASLPHVNNVYTKAALARMLERAAGSLAECGANAPTGGMRQEAERIWASLHLPPHAR
jgi:tetratricopeptide (TPR) repeat protein